MSTSGVLHSDADIRREIAEKSNLWLDVAQSWLSAPFEKDRLTLKGIQIYCLLLLARQVHRKGADLIWISMGSLTRMAMQMGLHQDPSSLGNMSLWQTEIRRRLWYTVLEMNIQAALDSGMTPMINESDYNTLPPSIIGDTDLDAVSNEICRDTTPPRTQRSFQYLLASSFSLRLRAARVINSLQEEPSYDQVLKLSQELAFTCRAAVEETAHSVSGDQPALGSQFAYSFCSHLLNRFLLCLHFRYAIQATKNPIYAHSHRVCLDVALDMVSLLDDELYGRLLVNGGGMFRDIITRGAMVIHLELNAEKETNISILAKERARARQEPLLKDARRVVQYAKDRLCLGETNVKGYIFLRMATAQTEAMLDGLPVEQAMRVATLESLEECETILNGMSANLRKDSVKCSFEAWGYNGDMSSPVLDDNFDFFANDGFDYEGLDSFYFQNLEDLSRF
ncbi:transcriptional regulator family: Fungal Specific TF [Penicillium taxi]|uniref:transcriptional regulator family: Fungal Specific TF n=1 Tax=Penicillium taxi TaxID=168475 RepID=UPI0025452612|nr:transcriptional regulator family: Fungal Specific TF [Penicillium taxi]KAJ5899065.1 transcriptional regulator family: Fungal Specific TF [Penicillium taxi]